MYWQLFCVALKWVRLLWTKKFSNNFSNSAFQLLQTMLAIYGFNSEKMIFGKNCMWKNCNVESFCFRIKNCVTKKRTYVNKGYSLLIPYLLKGVSRTIAQANNHTPKIKPPYFIDISIKTHQFVCIRQWMLVIIWPLDQHFKLKNQRNWLKQVWMLRFWSVINCIFVHWIKKLFITMA